MLKRFRNLFVCLLLLLSPWAGAVQLTSSDPYWLGASTSGSTTEGNDFWLTFMNNAMFSPAVSTNITFELKVAVSARQQTHIIFEIDGVVVHDKNVNANETYIYDMSALYEQIYLLDSEVSNKYKGVHVYTDEKNKPFSCFNYSRVGEAGESSRDATLILPTKFMGKEYYVQTYYEDTYSSEFAIVATEDNTKITIIPNYDTYAGHVKGNDFEIELLKKGDAYLVASAIHKENVVNVDLSGSKICADKPVAVFNGNQQTSIPFHESNSKDYLSEQIIPITQWGAEFYLALLGNTKENYTVLTAAYNDTHIAVQCMLQDGTVVVEPIDLEQGQSSQPLPFGDIKEMVIKSNHPIMCYSYTTSGGQNEERSGSIFNPVYIKYGDPANALMPSWAHRAKSMNFFTHDLDPYVAPGKPEPPKKYFVYIVTKSADKGKITIDGTGDYSAQFHPFMNDPLAEMSYASIEVTNNTSHYHTIETTGEGFVGMVYALSDAQGYLYTLGYSPEPFRDSLFVANTENVMDPKTYDVQPRLDQGWYQRQWDEWMSGHERLDTAQVCDGETVKWLLQSPVSKQTDPVDWYIYDVTNTKKTIYKTYDKLVASKEGASKDETADSKDSFRWEYKFEMPDESDMAPEDRTPYLEYEIQAIMHHKHVICNLPDDLDTIRTTVRVTRIYHDTIYKVICMGDTLRFFRDSLPHQGAQGDPKVLVDLPQDRTNKKSETLFIGDKTAGDNMTDFQWKARQGENIFRREYQTIYGCDSTCTLFLFVCDTFRTIDTLHLCKNEAVTYLSSEPSYQKTYKGIEYEGSGYLVTQDTVDEIVTKTKFCECQMGENKGKYPAFQGCDSIFEVHIFLHEIYRDTITDTMCYNRKPDSVYIWPIQEGTQEMHITKSHPNMQYDGNMRAWWGYFSDTLRTKTCPQCNEGRGCDSIRVLKLIIPEPFYEVKEDSICAWTYDYTTRSKVYNKYYWTGHRNNNASGDYLPSSGVYYDSCTTQFGCDSIYELHLRYDEPKLQVDRYFIATNQTYTWHGKTYGPFLDPEFKDMAADTTLYFYDENATVDRHGCDSIWRLDLTLSDTYLFRTYQSFCDIDSIHWRNKVVVGSQWSGTGTFNIRLKDQLTTTIDDSLFTIALPQRDSIYRLVITQYPTYDTILPTVKLCQDQSTYDWKREDDGSLIRHITFPVKSVYPFDTVFVDTLPTKTPMACDSILHLPVRIYPTYDRTMTVVLCETELPYTWELRDGATHDQQIDIPAADRGTLWHHTDQYTLTTIDGCDSVVHLDLTVKPVLRKTLTITCCAEMTPYPYGVHGKQASITGQYNDTTTSVQYGCDSITTYDITVLDKIEVDVYKTICDDETPYTYEENDTVPTWQGLTETGDYTYVFRQPGKCDSTVVLHLTVNPVRRETIERRTCQSSTPYKYENLNNGAEGYLPAQYLYQSLTRVDTIQTVLGCDSIVTLNFFVDSVYNYTRKDTVCQAPGKTWDWYENGVLQQTITLDKGDTTWILGTKYKTIHDCDSMYGISVYVAPIYHIWDTISLCGNDSVHWQGMLFTGYEYANYGKTYVETDFDSVKTDLAAKEYDYFVPRETMLGCDSVHHLHLMVRPIGRETIERRVCQSSTPYSYENLNNGAGGDLPAQYLYQSLTRNDTIHTMLGCDSIVTLHFFVDSVYNYTRKDTVCQAPGKTWDWYENGVLQQTITLDKGDTTWILGTKYKTIHDCDSMYGISVYVAPIYHIWDTISLCGNDSVHWQGMLFTGYEYANYGKTYVETDFDSVKTDLAAKEYDYSVPRETMLGCDSVHHLHLMVRPIGRETIERRVCQSSTPYSYENLNNGAKGYLPAQYLYQSLTRIDTIKTVLGCDSIVTLHFFVDSVYNYTRKDTVCQAPGKTWDWYENGVLQQTIPLDKGDTTWILGTNYKTIHECDSMYGISVYVAPIYHIWDTISLCGNDSAHWQGMLFTGYEYANYGKTYVETDFDSVKTDLAAKEYDYSVPRETMLGCDSVHHLHLRVLPIGRETIECRTCQSSTPYKYEHLNNGTGGYLPAQYLYQSLTRVDTIHTKLGCDSIVTLNFFVDSVYNYTRKDTVCQAPGKTWDWKENGVLQKTITLDKGDTTWILGTKYQTIHECDSMYGISVYVAPIYHIWDTISLCGNDSVHWQGMLFTGYEYANYGKTYVETDFDSVKTDLAAKEYDYSVPRETMLGCDSVHHLHLTVRPIGRETIERRTCQSNTPYHYEHLNNGAGGDLPAQYLYQSLTRNDTISTVLGCDSIVTLHFFVDSVYNYTRGDTVCQAPGMTWDWKENGVLQKTITLDKGDTTWILGTKYKTIHDCDSMYGISVYVAPIYHIWDTISLCGNDSAHWQGMLFTGYEYANYGKTYVATDFDSVKTDLAAKEYDYSVPRETMLGCDSVHHLHLRVLPIGRETIERRVCQSSTPYKYEHLNNGTGGDLPAQYLYQSLTRNDTIQTVLGCDSIVTLHFFVDSVYSYTRGDTVCQDPGKTWDWKENGVLQKTITLDKGDTTWILGTNYPTIHGCDSMYGISVYVAPIYHIWDTISLCGNDSAHWQGMLFTGYEYANYGKTYEATDFDSVKTDLAAKEYDYSVPRETMLGCDSVHHLHLMVRPIGRETIERRTCQSNTPYHYENMNNGTGGDLPAQYLYQSLTRNDTIHTELGCDSIVTLHFFVDSVYNYQQVIAVCQDTINNQWEWIDDEGHSHGFINISDSGNYSFDEPYTTIHGCDSLYGLKLRVKPIYRFDSTYVICENERLIWQGRQYTGDSVHDITVNDSIFLRPGLSYDTARYTTWEGCDSIYYVTIRVNPVFDTTTYFHTCANEPFIWHHEDHHGKYHKDIWSPSPYDTVYLTSVEAAADATEVPHLKYQKETQTVYRDTMLQTVHDCDSLSRMVLSVHPTYFFITDSTICSTEHLQYRGKIFPSKESKDTVYTEVLQTADGCDSVYQLRLHIKPSYLYTRVRDICDNETLIFPEDQRVVWAPGDPIPEPRDYIDFTYQTSEGCDSTYRYFVSVHSTYFDEREVTLCSGDSVAVQGEHYVGIDTIYDVNTFKMPIDSVFIDTLSSVFGCDSIFVLHAHILPQYYHLDTDTMCANDIIVWRAHTYEDMRPGDYVTFDSLKTAEGCDSVYEFRLHVSAIYYFEEHITKCADEDLTWRSFNLDHVPAGEHLITDSLLTTTFRCDSVYHLYLTVKDTTNEILDEVVCRTEAYNLHGVLYYEPGDYKDTIINDEGCHHFSYLHLNVTEPTVPTAWTDSICADDQAYELYYTYTGEYDPIAYSVYYDEQGHANGFTDLIDIPITTPEELHVLTLPMPLRNEDKTQYPRPDYYPIHLVLDNGVCVNPDLCDTDTSVVLSYPSWITEQHFGDVIALYNEKYNGGYHWDEFQWYHGDELLVGETHEYLYVPTGLIVGDQYYVRLTRNGETQDFQTCPITIVGDPVPNDFSPKMGYLSVVPTCIVTGHPYANILSRKDGTYRIRSVEGRLIAEGTFHADVTEVKLPAINGLYIFELWSPETKEEPYRSIKVIVKETCEGCNIPF